MYTEECILHRWWYEFFEDLWKGCHGSIANLTLHVVLLVGLGIHFGYGHFSPFLLLFFFQPCILCRSHEPAVGRGTGIIVAASNFTIFWHQISKWPYTQKKDSQRLFSSLVARLQGCLLLLFLAGCADSFKKPITVIRKCGILLFSVNFSEFCLSISWFAHSFVVK